MSVEGVGIELSIEVDGDVRPVRLRVSEAASRITHAIVEVATGEDVDFEPALGSQAELVITLGGASARRWTLVVGAVEFSRVEEGTFRHEVHLFARPWLMGHTRSTRKFQGMSAREIVSRVLAQHHVAHEVRLTREPKRRDYCVQYAESDLGFVSRLLEFEGIYYTFDDAGVMVLADRSRAAEPVDGATAYFELLDAAGALSWDELGISELRRVARAAPGRVTVNDFDWKNPKRPLLATRSADRELALEVYDFPTGFRDPADGELLARLRLEALRAPADVVEGTANVPTFEPGRRFSFGATAGDLFAGDYFLVEVEHEAEAAAFAGDEGSTKVPYQCRFRAIPLTVPFRPALETPRPSVAGCHTAMVRGPAGEEIHTDSHGRFRAQFHWDREAKGTDEDSRWIRLLQESATSMTLARVGWEVSVAYIAGDPDRPIGYARNINGVMPPAYAQPGNMNSMTVKTPSSPATGGFNEIKLDDSAGSQLFYVRAEKDYAAEVKNDKTETIGHDETRVIDHDLEHTVGRDQTIRIGHDSRETIEKDRKIEIKGARTKSVGASETVDVGAAATLSTAKDETERVGSIRFTFTGGFQMPDLAGRAKSVLKGMVPNPKAIAQGAASAAMTGAQGAAEKAFDAGGGLGSIGSAAASGALAGATGSLTQSLANLVPSPSGIASQLTGGLSDGVTVGKLADQFLVGSIQRTASDRTSRVVGGAFISAGVGSMATSASKAYVETVGGLKLTTSLTAGISQNVDGMLVVTVGGAVMKTAVADVTIASDVNRVSVGAALALDSAAQIHLVSKEIALTGQSSLAFEVEGASLVLDGGGVHLTGAVQVKAGEAVVVFGKDNLLA